MEEPANARTPAPPFSGRRGRSGGTIQIAERFLLVAGMAALGLVAFNQVEAGLFQLFQGRRLEEARPEGGGTSLLGRIEIRRLGLSVLFVEGVDSGTLRLAAGHLPGSALPGRPGNVVIAGHRDSFFRPLKDIRPNDEIEITTASGVFRYRVRSTRVVLPESTAVLDPTDLPTLTLVTCFPFNFIGNAPKRFVVEARQIDPPVARPSPPARAEAPVNRPLPTTAHPAATSVRSNPTR